jgi:Tol biopolymer transport system component
LTSGNINELIEGTLRDINITDRSGSRYLEISPDGKKILTVIDLEESRKDGHKTAKYLLLADIDGQNPRILDKFPPTPTYRLSYRFSPDSRKIVQSYYAFGGQREYDKEKVRIIDLSGCLLFEFESCQDINNEERCIVSTSGLSPDGKELIVDFEDYYAPKSVELGIMNITDGEVKIYGGKYFNKTHNFFFSADGNKIVYQKSTDPNPGPSGRLYVDDIYVMDRDGRYLKRLTNTSKFHEVILSVSPNGDEFVFWSIPVDDKNEGSIYVMSFDGSSKQEIRSFNQYVE